MVRWWILVVLLAACGKGAVDEVALAAAPVPTGPTVHADAAIAAQGTTRVFAGSDRTCALHDRQLYCWGDHRGHTLGTGPVTSQVDVPVRIAGVGEVDEVAIGTSHVCVRDATGAVTCWGANDQRQRGDHDGAASGTPRRIAIAVATQIAAAGDHTCAIVAGSVTCWGAPYPARVSLPLANIVQVAVGERHACARAADRRVWCWGDNERRQLATTGIAASATPIETSIRADELVAGHHFTCARTGGTIACWGDNDGAQLGSTDLTPSHTPRPVPDLDTAVQLSAGAHHACARLASGQVACWGNDESGGWTFPRGCPASGRARRSAGPYGRTSAFCATPIVVAGLEHVTAIASGASHVCALDRDQQLRCWGAGTSGQLANAAGYGDSLRPLEVAIDNPAPAGPSARATAVAAAGDWSCAIVVDGTVRCWGSGALGVLGPNVTDASAEPVAIDVQGVVELSTGSHHACARIAGTGVRCWGDNGHGTLGDGTTEPRSLPVPVRGLPAGVVAVDVSLSSSMPHSCALTRGGQVWCWGDNAAEQIARDAPALVTTPRRIAGLARATQVVAGEGGTCAVVGGAAHCWGAVPTPTGITRFAAPTALRGIGRIEELGLGAYAACARKPGGAVVCWGKHASGSPAPVVVPLSQPARAIAVGSFGAAAILTDGTVEQWILETAIAPVRVDGAEAIAQLACSGSHCCAIDTTGTAMCWGSNARGKLGSPAHGTRGESTGAVRVRL